MCVCACVCACVCVYNYSYIYIYILMLFTWTVTLAKHLRNFQEKQAIGMLLLGVKSCELILWGIGRFTFTNRKAMLQCDVNC